MIDLYYWPTPNGHKITIFLEEAKLPYNLIPVNIGAGEQFREEFLAISPSNKIPVIVDHEPDGSAGPVSVFESGAILLYLAEKTERFLPTDIFHRTQVLEWLFWQVGGLGPMLGQNHHFSQYAPEPVPYAVHRYQKETERLYGVLNNRLAGRKYLVDRYSIADMAAYPWIVPHEKQGIKLAEFQNLKHWFENVGSRPAVKRAYARAEAIPTESTLDAKAKAILFGQGRR
jgi:GST-like protein